MEGTRKELLDARYQISSTVHKLRAVEQTLAGKEDPRRYKSQLTLVKRRIQAFELATRLIDEALAAGQEEMP